MILQTFSTKTLLWFSDKKAVCAGNTSAFQLRIFSQQLSADVLVLLCENCNWKKIPHSFVLSVTSSEIKGQLYFKMVKQIDMNLKAEREQRQWIIWHYSTKHLTWQDCALKFFGNLRDFWNKKLSAVESRSTLCQHVRCTSQLGTAEISLWATV